MKKTALYTHVIFTVVRILWYSYDDPNYLSKQLDNSQGYYFSLNENNDPPKLTIPNYEGSSQDAFNLLLSNATVLATILYYL